MSWIESFSKDLEKKHHEEAFKQAATKRAQELCEELVTIFNFRLYFYLADALK